MQRLLVLSYDFDGSVFHNRGNSRSQNPIIDHNDALFSETKKKIAAKAYDEIIVMVGSNRQSQEINQKNTMRSHSESCYVAMEAVTSHLQQLLPTKSISLDGYLLADTYGQTPHGENFAKSVSLDQDYSFSSWFYDQSKLTILYAQMHRIASQHPNDKITYSFFDDLYFDNGDPDDLLQALNVFFTNNRDLIPSNITLNLNFYNGKEFKDLGKIVGTGPVDFHFEQSIKSMVECAGYDYKKDYYDRNNVLQELTQGSHLAQFTLQRDTNSKLAHSKINHPVTKQKGADEKPQQRPTIYLK